MCSKENWALNDMWKPLKYEYTLIYRRNLKNTWTRRDTSLDVIHRVAKQCKIVLDREEEKTTPESWSLCALRQPKHCPNNPGNDLQETYWRHQHSGRL